MSRKLDTCAPCGTVQLAAGAEHLNGRDIRPQDAFEILVFHSASRDEAEIDDLPAVLFKNTDPLSQAFVGNYL